MRRALVLLLGLLLAVPALEAQVISGVLIEADSRMPLAGGTMTLLGQDSLPIAQLRTDSAGAFSFELLGRGSYRLGAALPGYHPAVSPQLSIGAQDTLQVEFHLARNVVVLEPLVVKARSRRLSAAARRFYDRAQNSGFGTFITREEIERTHPMRTTDLFRRMPGVSTTDMMGGSAVVVRGSCRPTVWVDGVRVERYRSIDDLVHPLDLEGVEVYRAAHEAPVEYTGLMAGCAIVLIWTRID